MGFPTHILTKMIRVEINVRAVFAGTRARVLSDKRPIEVRSNDLRDQGVGPISCLGQTQVCGLCHRASQ